MSRAVIIVALVACASAPPPKTDESMRWARLTNHRCERECPLGGYIKPIEPQGEHILEDCCYDIYGIGWSSCAWNGAGRYMTTEQLLSPARLTDLGNCGGDEWPDCRVQ